MSRLEVDRADDVELPPSQKEGKQLKLFLVTHSIKNRPISPHSVIILFSLFMSTSVQLILLVNHLEKFSPVFITTPPQPSLRHYRVVGLA